MTTPLSHSAITELTPAMGSAIDSLARLFATVIALALAEAFKQFVSDDHSKDQKPRVHWDRLPSLFIFLILLIPFSHGMARYFYDTYYVSPLPTPYPRHLLIDCAVFTAEAALFFFLSRRLAFSSWLAFFRGATMLLLVDAAWALHTLFRDPSVMPWFLVNLGAATLLAFFCFQHKKGLHPEKIRPQRDAIFCMCIVLARTVLDYWLAFDFYFPKD